MKKTLIALAALGAMVGAAQAQSSVTLYGKLDIGLVHSKAGADTLEVRSGNLSGSRWGLMGSEDLGGGLKANFTLEQGFRIDDGGAAVAGKQFSRNAWVGLSGGFGELRVGMPYTAYDDVSGAFNSVYDSVFSVENGIFKSVGYAATPGNTIRYSTPSFGGFTAVGSYSLRENNTANVYSGSVALSYANGPVAVGFGYQVEPDRFNAPDTKFTRLGASYDFGPAVLKAVYGNAKIPVPGTLTSVKTNDYALSVDVPVGAVTFSAGLGYSKDKNAEKRKGFSLGALYALSKRTELYAAVGDWDGKTAGVKTTDETIYGLGVRHSF